jgi:hypothetical protein
VPFFEKRGMACVHPENHHVKSRSDFEVRASKFDV